MLACTRIIDGRRVWDHLQGARVLLCVGTPSSAAVYSPRLCGVPLLGIDEVIGPTPKSRQSAGSSDIVETVNGEVYSDLGVHRDALTARPENAGVRIILCGYARERVSMRV